MLRRTSGLALLMVLALDCMAGVATVEFMQAPAWVEGAQGRYALQPGATLQGTEKLITGRGSRLLLTLADGSLVKLGETTTFELRGLQLAPNDRLLTGAFAILSGAFRFTTSLLSRDFRRDIRASVGTATIGIRGTDVWGRAGNNKDFVVLIEGEIEISRGAETTPITTPLTVYDAPHAQPMSLRPIAEPELLGYAAETEPSPTLPKLTAAGAWEVVVGSYRSVENAARLRVALDTAGWPSTTSETTLNGAPWHRVQVSGFDDRPAALAAADLLRRQLGEVTPWVRARK